MHICQGFETVIWWMWNSDQEPGVSGCSADTWHVLHPVLLQMLPEVMALDYSQQRRENYDWKTPDIYNSLEKVIQSRESFANEFKLKKPK